MCVHYVGFMYRSGLNGWAGEIQSTTEKWSNLSSLNFEDCIMIRFTVTDKWRRCLLEIVFMPQNDYNRRRHYLLETSI